MPSGNRRQGEFDPLARDLRQQGINERGAVENFDQASNIFDPDVTGFANSSLRQNNIDGDVRGYDDWANFIQAGLDRAPRDNPYDMAAGNQSRDAYSAALDRLHNGTSAVASQNAAAMGQLQQNVASATAQSGGLAQAMAARIGAQGAGQQALAGGMARNQEFMGQQQGYGGGLNAMRGQDLGQAKAFQDSGLQARGQDDALHNFYADQGVTLRNSREDLQSKLAQLREQIEVAKDQKNWAFVKSATEAAATLIKMIAGA